MALGNLKDVRESVKTFRESGSIKVSFERKGGGKITYSHRQHTKSETNLMKTGRPEHYLPSQSTVSRDVRLVFVNCRRRIAMMLKMYKGRLSFATDAWTAPNHKPFVAVSAHLEHEGKPLSFILDIIEVASVSNTHEVGVT
ncbi:hypothetical protein JAAARDRAFT_132649 [Jaapia argillacea MUCL 33604]|uniref:DUF659 domain-containing protein n=1 Tax=Jaapia argillacea MUCL 33604 TaxID=933084 RepID=A0A067PNZ2_9AGAM|nr:hypothetical protein JAAARDRAFT_132649 [Jaapia argillacea MUCL 33604]